MSVAGIHRRLTVNVTNSLRVRMRDGVRPKNENGCIEWDGALRNGYGCIKHEGRVLSTHIVAWVLAGNELGDEGDGKVIAHKCDNKACCNPDHLECVSITKNNRDGFLRRKRNVMSGEQLPHTKLTESQARKIIELYQPRTCSYVRIAKILGISESLVQSVIAGESWINLPRKEGMRPVKRGRYSNNQGT